MRTDRLIEKYFDGELTVVQEERLRRRLRRSAALRARFDRMAHVLRAASDGSQARRETEALWRRIEHGLTQEAPRENAAASGAADSAAGRGFALWLPLGAAALVLVGLVVSLTWRVSNDRGLTLKGGDTTATVVDFDLFAIAEAAGGSFGQPRPIGVGQSLTLSDLIQFRYLSGDEVLAHLYLVGIDESGQVLRYHPRPGERRPIRIAPTMRKRAVARSIRLGVRHRPGRLTIVALFARDPIENRRFIENLDELAERIRLGRQLEAGLDWGTRVELVAHDYRVVGDPSQ